MDKKTDDSAGKCPFTGGPGGHRNRNWWPEQLDIGVLHTNAPAADTQGNSKADVERTAAIRKAIKGHKDLSTYANNVKIVTQNNRVTLRGPVRDESEKALIGKIATDIAGAENVTNDLDIAPKKK